MPLKAVLAANALAIIIILKPLGTQGDTNIAKLSEQLVE